MYCGGHHNIEIASTCHKQMPDHISRVKTVAADLVAYHTLFFHETLQAVFKSLPLKRTGTGDGNGGVLGKVQVCIGEDRGAIPGYISCPFVRVGTRLQQPRATERRPGDNPEKIITLARCHCCIASICFRVTNASLPTRVNCSLNIVVM